MPNSIENAIIQLSREMNEQRKIVGALAYKLVENEKLLNKLVEQNKSNYYYNRRKIN